MWTCIPRAFVPPFSRVILLLASIHETVKSSGRERGVNVLLAVTGLREILLRILRPRNGFLHCPSATLRAVRHVSDVPRVSLGQVFRFGTRVEQLPAVSCCFPARRK